MSGIIVTAAHMREADVCWPGAERWLQRKGLSPEHFLERGYPIETLEAFNDGIVNRICRIARQEADNGRQQ